MDTIIQIVNNEYPEFELEGEACDARQVRSVLSDWLCKDISDKFPEFRENVKHIIDHTELTSNKYYCPEDKKEKLRLMASIARSKEMVGDEIIEKELEEVMVSDEELGERIAEENRVMEEERIARAEE